MIQKNEHQRNGEEHSDDQRPTGSIEKNGIVYLITIKNNSFKYTSIDDLHALYMWLVKKIKGAHWHTGYAIELDAHDRLHIHGLFTRDSKVNVGSYKRAGYTVHFQIFDTYEHAKGYMYKQDQCDIARSIREAESYYRYNYGFI